MPDRKTLLIFAPPGEPQEDLARIARAWGFTLRRISTPEALEEALSRKDFDLLLLPSRRSVELLFQARPPESDAPLSTLAEAEKQHILRVLAAARGNKSLAARILDVDPKTLYNRLKRYREEEKAAGGEETGREA